MLRTYSVCVTLRRSLSSCHHPISIKRLTKLGPEDVFPSSSTSRRNLSLSSSHHINIKRLEKLTAEEESLPASKSRKLVDIFKYMNAWKSIGQLSDYLYDNVVYYDPKNDKSGLVVINKPHGLAVYPAKDSAYCLEMCLPLLAKKLSVDELHIIKSVERFSSGIALLATSPDTAKLVQETKKKASSQRLLTSGFLGLVVGHASLPAIDTVEVRLEECKNVEKPLFSDKHREPVITRNFASNSYARERRRAKLFHIGSNVVAKSGTVPVSLVRLSPNSCKNHFVPVWLADRGCPLLGDQLYDYRARTLLGHKVKVGVKHTQASRQQKLPTVVAEKLGIEKNEEWRVPKLLHQFRINFPKFLGEEKKDLTVYAPPPMYFILTSKAFGIDINFTDIVEKDEVEHWKKIDKPKKKKEADTNSTEADNSDLRQNILRLKP